MNTLVSCVKGIRVSWKYNLHTLTQSKRPVVYACIVDYLNSSLCKQDYGSIGLYVLLHRIGYTTSSVHISFGYDEHWNKSLWMNYRKMENGITLIISV